jgi:hypothetical protein
MKTRTSQKTLGGKRTTDDGILTSAAESIGSTIGAIVGSAAAARKVMTQKDGIRSVKRRSKKLVQKSKQTRRRTKTKR